MGNGQRPPGGDHHQQGPPPHGQGNGHGQGQGQPYGWQPQEQPYGWQPQEQRQDLPHEGAAPAPWGARTEPPGHPAPWSAQTVPSGLPPHPGASRTGGSRRSAVVAVVAATAVVLAAGVTGFLVLGDGGDDGKPDAGPARADTVPPSASPGETRAGAEDGTAPLVPGWKTVVNPKRGIAFDVPAAWALKSTGWVSYVAENSDPEETPLVGFSAPAILKEKWCRSDDDGNGTQEDTPLAAAGSRGEPDARSTAEAARENARLWVYGSYAQPSKEKVTTGAAKPFTTRSGITGSMATATSTGVDGTGRCSYDGRATAFAFENPAGETVSWTFVGVRGVDDEVPEPTVRKILGTVRLVDSTP
ncbi:hypothetical protein OHA57_34850 [Streptomyces anulatus]|uniref:hypothetical protein n=1 Tax=Streptomyces anulatus TaxID=1892 RepID=UPI002DD89D20|nr:hypothetical protein [Streptomyces anulatus]WSC65635.1 hypothetical protein OHA57_34850 [Streptomyces anulatus]